MILSKTERKAKTDSNAYLFDPHKTDLNQTWQKCSLDGHIQDFCFWR